MTTRLDPEKHRKQVRAANAARAAAIRRLIERYPHLFDRLYREEAAKLGVEPSGRRR